MTQEYNLELEFSSLLLENIGDYFTCSFTDNPLAAIRLTYQQAKALRILLETHTKHYLTEVECPEN